MTSNLGHRAIEATTEVEATVVGKRVAPTMDEVLEDKDMVQVVQVACK